MKDLLFLLLLLLLLLEGPSYGEFRRLPQRGRLAANHPLKQKDEEQREACRTKTKSISYSPLGQRKQLQLPHNNEGRSVHTHGFEGQIDLHTSNDWPSCHKYKQQEKNESFFFLQTQTEMIR